MKITEQEAEYISSRLSDQKAIEILMTKKDKANKNKEILTEILCFSPMLLFIFLFALGYVLAIFGYKNEAGTAIITSIYCFFFLYAGYFLRALVDDLRGTKVKEVKSDE